MRPGCRAKTTCRSSPLLLQRPNHGLRRTLRGDGQSCRAEIPGTEEKRREQAPLPHEPAVEATNRGGLSELAARLPAADELSLFLVAALWGSNPVCLRYIYQLQVAPTPASLAAIQASGAALLLTLASLAAILRPQDPASSNGEVNAGPLQGLLEAESVGRAGAELGFWTFLANAATITAFQHTPASRGAFLIRLTAVFTPAVASLLGQRVGGREWAACGAALLGGILITLDTALGSESTATDAALGFGDVLMVGSACLWSLQTVRLGHHAQRHQQLSLARNQTGVFALLSLGWLAQIWATAAPGDSPVGSLLAGGTPPLVWAAVLWPAVGPWGLGALLQVRAQKTVSPSRTQVIMATDPLWATAFAGLLAGEQGLGGLGWLGAACILSGSVISRH